MIIICPSVTGEHAVAYRGSPGSDWIIVCMSSQQRWDADVYMVYIQLKPVHVRRLTSHSPRECAVVDCLGCTASVCLQLPMLPGYNFKL